MHLVGLEMLGDAFLAPCFGRKVTQKSIYWVKYLRDPTKKVAPRIITSAIHYNLLYSWAPGCVQGVQAMQGHSIPKLGRNSSLKICSFDPSN